MVDILRMMRQMVNIEQKFCFSCCEKPEESFPNQSCFKCKYDHKFLCSNIQLQTASPLQTFSTNVVTASAQTLNSVKCYEASYQEKLEENYVFPFIDTKLISTVKMRYQILAQFIKFNVLDRRSFGQNHKSYFALGRCCGWSRH